MNAPQVPPQAGWTVLSVRETVIPGKHFADPRWSVTAVRGEGRARQVLKRDKLSAHEVANLDLNFVWSIR